MLMVMHGSVISRMFRSWVGALLIIFVGIMSSIAPLASEAADAGSGAASKPLELNGTQGNSDPIYRWSTYLGGTGIECFFIVCAVAIDGAGNTYVAGETRSADFPTVDPLYDACGREPGGDISECSLGSGDGFLTKFTPTGEVLFSTYLGSDGNDDIHTIATDAQGNIYVGGATNGEPRSSQNPYGFPISADAVQPTLGGSSDGFIIKFDAAGQLVYSTYIGGEEAETIHEIAVDPDGNIYVTGFTESNAFPTTANVVQPAKGGDTFDGDAFVVKYAADGTLIYSTYLGGVEDDYGYGITADASGHAYVTGQTYSADFPAQNPLQTCDGNNAPSFCRDAFVSKLSPQGDALVWSTHLDGNGSISTTLASDIALDAAGNVYIVGDSAYAFVAKLAGDGRSLLYITELTQSLDGFSSALELALHPAGLVYVAGVIDAASPSQDAFLSIVSTRGQLLHSQRLGGTDSDSGAAIAVHPDGDVVIVGETESSDFPVTPGAFQPTLNDASSDVFVSKLSFNLYPGVVYIPLIRR